MVGSEVSPGQVGGPVDRLAPLLQERLQLAAEHVEPDGSAVQYRVPGGTDFEQRQWRVRHIVRRAVLGALQPDRVRGG